MKKRFLHTVIVLIAAANYASALPVWRWMQNIPTIPELTDAYNEDYILLTERSMYATGEEIRFTVFNNSPAAIRSQCWSRVLYVHLLKPDGSSAARAKVPLDCEGTGSVFKVPEELLTGNYYLCAYTRWMRNFNPSHYSVVPLKIINPYTDELLMPEENDVDGIISEYPEPAEFRSTGHHRLRCSTDKDIYNEGEEIRLSIHYPGVFGADQGRISISIARPGAMDTLFITQERKGNLPGSPAMDQGFLPEIRGLSLSGKVFAGDEPVEQVPVELSIFSRKPVFMTYRSDKEGAFYFSMESFEGKREMFLTARNTSGEKLDIVLDKEYSEQFPSFSVPAFTLSEAEKQAAREIMINMQLQKLYRSHPEEAVPDSSRKSIHGLPVRKLWIDEYIELPNLKEVFIELVPEVTPRVRNRKNYLSFNGNDMTRGIIAHFNPLILVDQIPVYNIDEVLALEPRNIRSIEVINDVYMIGNSPFGGFINIESNKGDGGGINLPEPSFFLGFEGFTSGQPMELEAEFRNFIFWDPVTEISPEQERILTIPAAGLPGEYTVLVRGVTDDRSFLYGKCSFRIAASR